MKKVLYVLPERKEYLDQLFSINPKWSIHIQSYSNHTDNDLNNLKIRQIIKEFIDNYNIKNIGCAIMMNPYRWQEITSPLYAYLKLNNIPVILREFSWVDDAETNKIYLLEETLNNCKYYKKLRNYIDNMTQNKINKAKEFQYNLFSKKQTNIIDQDNISNVNNLPDKYIFLPMLMEWHDYNNNGYKIPNERFYRDIVRFVNDRNLCLVIKLHPHLHRYKNQEVEQKSYLSILKKTVKKLYVFQGHIHDVMSRAITTITLNNEKIIIDGCITGTIVVNCGYCTLDSSVSFIQCDNAYQGLQKAVSFTDVEKRKMKEEQPKLIYYIYNVMQSPGIVKLWIENHLNHCK